MSHDFLDEREFELVNIIGAQLGSNQRDLSRLLDLSLGQTNMLVRRLVAKGFIRISQLNQKKVSYLLTPKGLAEKMKKSVNYTLKTIHSISAIKEQIKHEVIKLYNEGERNFVIVGKSDFALLIEMVFRKKGLHDYHISYMSEMPHDEVKGTILLCREGLVDGSPSRKVVNLIEELAKNHEIVTNGKGRPERVSPLM